MKKKILQIFKFAYPYSYGGIEFAMHNISKGLVSGGFNVDVLATVKGNKVLSAKQDNYNLKLFPYNFILASTPFSISMFFWALKNLHKYDVVYLHYPYPFADLLALFMPKRAKLVVIYHSDIVRQSKFLKFLYKPLERKSLNRASIIIGTSPQYLKSSENLKNLNNSKTFVSLGIDDPINEPEKKPEIDFDFNKPFLLFVGALRYYKGLDVLLKAMKEIDCQLILIGVGDQLKDLTQYKKKHNLEHVHLVGKLTDHEKNYCYRRAIGFTFPSNQRSEAFGLALLEASAFCLPMITCEINTGTSFVNIHGETGLVVDPNNHTQLSIAINKIVQDDELRESFGKAARLRYENMFSSITVGKKHSKILSDLTNS